MPHMPILNSKRMQLNQRSEGHCKHEALISSWCSQAPTVLWGSNYCDGALSKSLFRHIYALLINQDPACPHFCQWSRGFLLLFLASSIQIWFWSHLRKRMWYHRNAQMQQSRCKLHLLRRENVVGGLWKPFLWCHHSITLAVSYTHLTLPTKRIV